MKNKNKIVISGLAVLLLIVISFTGWKYLSAKKAADKSTTGILNSRINYVNKSNTSADRYIATLELEVRDNSDNVNLLIKLGSAYIQKARESNDPDFYLKAENALNLALELDVNSSSAMSELGSIHLSRHEFQSALELGSKALSINPYSSNAYSIIADAQIELGQYNEAIESIQKMIDLRPDLSSYSRVSYIRELKGDIKGAIDAMQAAIQAGSPSAENTAWCRVQLGNLFYNSSEIEKAENEFLNALKDYNGYIHAFGGLAKVKTFKKDYQRAIEYYKRALEINSLPEYLTALGDIYKIMGQNELADEQYKKVKFISTYLKESGIDTDIELAIFKADHNINLKESLSLVEESLKGSKSIKTYHALAWIQFKLDDLINAEKNIEQAIQLGTKDPLMMLHAGIIFKNRGQYNKAKSFLDAALKINPYYKELYSENLN